MSYRDVLPASFDGQGIGDAIFGLAPRPRDVIALFNCCINAGVDKPIIGAREFSIALGEYSRTRLRALADEWYADFPRLLDYASILKGRPTSFKISAIPEKDVEDLCLAVVVQYPLREGMIHPQAHSVVDGELATCAFREALFFAFYKTGLVGLKTAPDAVASWRDDSGQAVTSSQVGENTGVAVHAAYWRALGMKAGN